MIFDTPFVTIPEIDIGGKYSNQVATLESKIDALTLDMREVLDKLNMIKTAFDRSFDIELDVLPERKFGIEKQCECKDSFTDRDPDYPNVYNPL